MQVNANFTFNTHSISTPITWFPYIGANQYVTPDITSMTSSESYTSTNQLHVADGKGLVISYIAYSKIHTPKHIHLPYPIFYTYRILHNLCYLFKSFV
jgi:hypothetical protein